MYKKDLNAFDVAISIPCPSQSNNCDCGLFAAVVVSYIIGGHDMTPQTFSQQQISTMKKAMVYEFDVVEGKVVFDPELFKSWFPGMDMNYTLEGKATKRKTTISQRFPRNYDENGNDLFPAEDIVHLMDDYTLAIMEEEEVVIDWEQQMEELVVEEDEKEEEEVVFAGTTPSKDKDKVPSSPEVKFTKVQAAPAVPPATAAHAPEDDEEDDGVVVFDELKTLEQRMAKAKKEFDRTQMELDVYKQLQGLEIQQTAETEYERELEEEEMKEETKEEQVEEPRQDLQFVEMYNELVPEGVFTSTDLLDKFIAQYETASSNKLLIVASKLSRGYKVFGCAEHENCPFRFHVGRKRGGDGNTLVVKNMVALHKGRRREPKAKDGRKWKTRRAGRYNTVIKRIRQHKEKPPSAGDVMKAVATQQNETICYTTAWRSLEGTDRLQMMQQITSFQLIIPYLERLRRDNQGSRIIWEKYPDTERIRRLFLCPSFMNETVKFVIPVISLDGAHMDSRWKGTLLTASALSPNRELYPLAFAFTEGNEDHQAWDWFLLQLRSILPTLDSPYDDNTCPYMKYVFVSDRCKGLKTALEERFAGNLSTSCAFHIKENVRALYGAVPARYVVSIAKEFSTREENRLFNAVAEASPAAHAYLQRIGPETWRSTQWTQEELPRRFGIVTSNTSEALNSWWRGARSLTWSNALETIIDKMINRISECREKYKMKEDSDIVPFVHQLLVKRWRMIAGYVVVRVEESIGIYKVNEIRGDDSDREEGNEQAASVLPREEQAEELPQGPAQVVQPGIKECSCGKWQEYLYPCRHALAYFRLGEEKTFQWILENEVSDLWRYKTLKQLYGPNLFPVVMSSVRGDGVTQPPRVRRGAGRPRTRRLRRRMQREGMVILPGTDELDESETGGSDEGPIESERNSDDRNESYEDPME